MTKRGLPMYQIREILGLHYEHGWADRAIARAHSVSHVTVGDLVRRFEQTGIGWPMPERFSSQKLDRSRLVPHGQGISLLWMKFPPSWSSLEVQSIGFLRNTLTMDVFDGGRKTLLPPMIELVRGPVMETAVHAEVVVKVDPPVQFVIPFG